MYDKYGAPGFLAAYNAGPDRVDSYLAGGGPLPDETVNYLAAITPNLGSAVPLSGPLAMYAAGPAAPTLVSTSSLASGCDANAAFDPDRPCTALEREATAPTVAATPPPPGGCDADTAYDPDQPCRPVRSLSLAAAPVPAAGAGWAVQVGAFTNPGLARAVAEGARAEAPGPLGSAALALPATAPSGGSMLYRARLTNLSSGAAASACAQLNQRQLPCVVVPPAGS